MTFSDTTLELTDIQKKRHFFWNRTNKFLGNGSSLSWNSNSKSEFKKSGPIDVSVQAE
jgi:hypothetical protein